MRLTLTFSFEILLRCIKTILKRTFQRKKLIYIFDLGSFVDRRSENAEDGTDSRRPGRNRNRSNIGQQPDIP